MIPGLTAALRKAHGEWPAELSRTDLAARDEAVAAYFEALRLSFDDDERSDRPASLRTRKRFDALLAGQPNDAYLLYRAARNLFDGFASASRWGREDQSDRLIRKADTLVARLMRPRSAGPGGRVDIGQHQGRPVAKPARRRPFRRGDHGTGEGGCAAPRTADAGAESRTVGNTIRN